MERIDGPVQKSKTTLHTFSTQDVHLKEEYFGRAYEEIRKYKAIANSDEVQFVEDPDRKAHGKYYTPEDVTCLMVAKSTDLWLSNKGLRQLNTDTKLRVLDPTVGSRRIFIGNGALSRNEV